MAFKSRQSRVHTANQHPPNPKGGYVLYLCQVNRRSEANHALARAAHTANQHAVPLLVCETLSYDDPQANDRHHTFVLEGIPAMARSLREQGAGYCFYLRRSTSDPAGVPAALAKDAVALITDDFPSPSVRGLNTVLAASVPIPVHLVDASCVVPMRNIEKKQYAAYTIRPRMHRLLPEVLAPVDGWSLDRQWHGPPPVFHTEVTEENIPALVASCNIDHTVPPSITYRGSRNHALGHLERFLQQRLSRYADQRNEPTSHATSNLSVYLHHGRIGALEVALAARSYAQAHGLEVEGFLEELIVRRELAFNHAFYTDAPTRLEHLPSWARNTLQKHASDTRHPCYTYEQFESASTDDTLWNATQQELRLRGTIHGYYRMYWGKKIIEWSPTTQDALNTMLQLHQRYALDGGDPNTWTNILWCFGLHDRPWGERPIFGQVRYMALSGMQRKTDVNSYLREIGYLVQYGIDPHRLQ